MMPGNESARTLAVLESAVRNAVREMKRPGSEYVGMVGAAARLEGALEEHLAVVNQPPKPSDCPANPLISQSRLDGEKSDEAQ